MKSISLAAAICLSIFGLAVPRTAHAAESFLEGRDPAGDVTIYDNVDGLSQRDRESIDTRRAWVSKVDRGTFRASVKLRRVADRSTRWDQMIFFESRPQNDRRPDRAEIGFTNKPRIAGYAYDTRTDEQCDLGAVTRKPARDVLSIDVPARCMPREGWHMDVNSFTGVFYSDEPAYSKDRVHMGRLYYP